MKPTARTRCSRLWLTAVPAVLFAGWTGRVGAQDPREPAPPTRHLAVAEEAGRWLLATARRDGQVWTWPACPKAGGADVHNLYSGGAGVALLFCELHHATGDAAWLDAARCAARGLARDFDAVAARQGAGLFTGAGGMLLALEVVREATRERDVDEPAFEEAVGHGLEWYASHLDPADPEAPVSFGPVTDIISGDAGIGELMLWFAARRPDSRAGAVAAALARHLADTARQTDHGWRWMMSPDYPRAMPNYSHGTAGVAAFLVAARELYPAGLEKAVGGGEWLLHLADARGMVHHHQPGGEELYYWGWCHGPAGTSLLFARLAQATGEARWSDAARRPIEAVLASGLPTARLDGLWNTVGQCCGTIGVGEYLLRFADGDAALLAFCERLADDAASRGTASEKGRAWVQAEHRVRPDLLQAQVGWAQGAAGIGLGLLHLDAALRGRNARVQLPWM